MSLTKRRRRENSSGMSTIGIVVLVLLISGMFFLIVQVGPAYLDKWKLQDRMRITLLDDFRNVHRSLAYNERSISAEGEYQLMWILKEWCEREGIPLDPTKDDPPACTLDAELYQRGRLECRYPVELNFIFYKRPFTMRAVVEVPKVPGF